MTRILIPTDFSENAWNALTYGLELLPEKSTIYLLHVNPIPLYSAAGSTVVAASRLMEESLMVENKRQLDVLMTRIRALPLKHKHIFVPITAYDYFVDCVKREVEDKNIDLIIMGTKGASGLKKVTLGSNTGAVITKVKCAILAIPENARYQQIREIAFPTDYHTGFDIKVLNNLIHVVRTTGATLRILHISRKGEQLSQEQEQNKEFLHEYLSDLNHSFHSITSSRLETAVQCFVESRDIDMVAMVAKNLNFFQRILFRPAVEEISYHTDIPFLVLHE